MRRSLQKKAIHHNRALFKKGMEMALVCQKKKRSSLLQYRTCLHHPGIESKGRIKGLSPPAQQEIERLRNDEAVAVEIVVAISGHSDQANFPRLRRLLSICVQIRTWEKRGRAGNRML